MSNPTIELGGGKWATKPTSLLAYNNNPEWGFNPKEFTVDRNSTATCIGSDGLIKTVAANEARIDFSNDVNGALLCEPQRTNLITYSNLNTYSRALLSEQTGIISPDGTTNAVKLIPTTADGVHYIPTSSFSLVDNTTYTASIYAKKEEFHRFSLEILTDDGTYGGIGDFDILNNTSDTVGRLSGTNTSSTKIVDAGNGWVRCMVTFLNTTGASAPRVNLVLSNNTSYSFVGDGTSGISFYGLQVEQASTASSYIPTNGTTVSRVFEYITKPIEFASEFTFILEHNLITAENTSSSTPILRLHSAEGRDIYLYRNGFSTQPVNIYLPNDGGYIYGSGANTTNLYGKNKFAISYDGTHLSYYINGAIYNTPYEMTNPNLNKIDFYSLGIGSLWGGIKYYNQALTDAELITLTTI